MDSQKLMKWLSRQEQAMWLAVVQQQLSNRREFLNDKRMRGQKAQASPEEEFSFFLEAINKFSKLSKKRNLTIFNDLKMVDELKKACTKKPCRPAKKKDAFLELEEEIMTLRNGGASWQAIADYLAKNHKKRASRGYLHKLFAEK